MSADKDRAERQDEPAASTPFDRFADLTKRLLHVSKDEVREAEAKEREDRARPPRSA